MGRFYVPRSMLLLESKTCFQRWSHGAEHPQATGEPLFNVCTKRRDSFLLCDPRGGELWVSGIVNGNGAPTISKVNFPFLASPTACRSSQARERTHTTAVTWDIAVTMPTAYGGSPARSQIRAVATGLCYSHSHARSEPHLQSTPQLTAVSNP